MKTDFNLLKKLCAIHAPSGNEIAMKEFLLDHINENKKSWNVEPEIIIGEEIQDCIILKFGIPKVAIFAHIDSIGYTVRYNNEVVKIGGPVVIENCELVGEDHKGKIETRLTKREDKLFVDYHREIDRGTELVFKQHWVESNDYVQSCYLDNRLGVWNALKVCETLEHGVIVFSCWEEHVGGSVGYLAKYIYENWKVQKAIISDITWITDGVTHGNGVAISLRDRGIPRRSYVNRILQLAKESGINFQLEVEGSGGSDGTYLQESPYPFDWIFIGAAEDNVHTPFEKVHKYDIECMWRLYDYLMKYL